MYDLFVSEKSDSENKMTKSTVPVSGEAIPKIDPRAALRDRRNFIGGSDARVIIGKDEKALARLWKEKRGDGAPVDLSRELIVQLGLATEDLNRRWYEGSSGNRVRQLQQHVV